MPEAENWAEYGFPDNLTFRQPYIPWVGLIKALNERRQAVNLEPFPVPDYFTAYGGQAWVNDFEGSLYGAILNYVNPDKISSAKNYRGCFWEVDELEEAALDGEEMDIVTNPLRPFYSVKRAVWIYNQINILRYVPTSDPEDWPTFTYADRYSTFNFKG